MGLARLLLWNCLTNEMPFFIFNLFLQFLHSLVMQSDHYALGSGAKIQNQHWSERARGAKQNEGIDTFMLPHQLPSRLGALGPGLHHLACSYQSAQNGEWSVGPCAHLFSALEVAIASRASDAAARACELRNKHGTIFAPGDHLHASGCLLTLSLPAWDWQVDQASASTDTKSMLRILNPANPIVSFVVT